MFIVENYIAGCPTNSKCNWKWPLLLTWHLCVQCTHRLDMCQFLFSFHNTKCRVRHITQHRILNYKDKISSVHTLCICER